MKSSMIKHKNGKFCQVCKQTKQFFVDDRTCIDCDYEKDATKGEKAQAAFIKAEKKRQDEAQAAYAKPELTPEQEATLEEKVDKDAEAARIRQAEERAKAEFDAKREAEQELIRRELSRRKLLPFVERFNDQYEAGWVHKDICRRLEQFSQDVADRKSPRLMLFMPPRHGKSELASKTFPGWHLGRHPDHEVISCSYTGDLAMDFSRKVRELLRDRRYHQVFRETKLDKDSQSAQRWNTTSRGGYVAAGVGGPITGRGAHVLIIDDPIKNRDDAESETNRESIWNWYTSTAYTRLAPGGGVLIILTRWHDDDLAGRLLTKMKEGEGDEWQVIQYPALATENERFRKEGEALHPERYDEDALHRIKRAVGSRDWSALYQQNPVADDGEYFTKDMFRFYTANERPPLDELHTYTAWDLAIGQGEANDFTVGITVGVDRNDNIWLLQALRFKKPSLEIVESILDMYERWKPKVTGIERGQIEMAIGPLLDQRIRERGLFSFYYESLRPGKRDKQTRARSIQGRMQQGMVYFPKGDDTVQVGVNEMLRFPMGVHDDFVDALAWIGLMLDTFVTPRMEKPKPKMGWRETRLRKLIGNTGRRSSMSA